MAVSSKHYEIHFNTKHQPGSYQSAPPGIFLSFVLLFSVQSSSAKAGDSRQSIIKSTNCKGSNLLAASWALPPSPLLPIYRSL